MSLLQSLQLTTTLLSFYPPSCFGNKVCAGSGLLPRLQGLFRADPTPRSPETPKPLLQQNLHDASPTVKTPTLSPEILHPYKSSNT